MKNRIEEQELLADVLGENEQGRAQTLERVLVELRRVRSRRRVARLTAGALVPLLIIAAMLTIQRRQIETPLSPQTVVPVAQTPRTIEGTSIRVLSDEELLDLFRGRPIALVGSPGHQRLLLFDEK